MKIFVSFILLVNFGLLVACYGQQQISGNWISGAPERNPNGSFSIRKFSILHKTWEVQYTLYTDSRVSQPVFMFKAGGVYILDGLSKVLANTSNAVFSFSKKYITLKVGTPH